MELDECIKKRRSIRKYLDKEVSNNQIGDILKAASYAPSSGNIQNWRFVVVRDKKKKNEISAAALKQYWMNTAPVFIVVCNDLKDVRDLYGERGEKLYSIQNCAAAAENIMLKATDLGLATCCVGAFDEAAVARILKLPDDVIPEIIITLGYSDEKIIRPPFQRHTIDKLTFFEEWGKFEKEESFSMFPLEKQEKRLEEAAEKGRSKVKEFFRKFKKK